MPDDAGYWIRDALRDSKKRIAERLHRAGQLIPLWMERELESLGRACFQAGEKHAHTKGTTPRSPFDDEPTPVRDPWGENE